MNKVFLPILLGTNRDGRESEKIAVFILNEIKKRDDIDTELIDVRDLEFTRSDYGENLKELPGNKKWKEAVIRADGLILVSPEYNHGYSGILKWALDMMEPEYNNKAVGVAALSSGSFGGVRMLYGLTPVLKRLGLKMLKNDLLIPNVEEFNPEEYIGKTETFLTNLSGLALACRVLRNSY